MRVIVTGGGTREPIDRVRFIGNFSTGRTAAALVDGFLAAGDEVLYVHGEGAALPEAVCEKIQFTTFQDLDQTLIRVLESGKWDVVVHAAAVADFTVGEIRSATRQYSRERNEKIESSEELMLRLIPTPKLVSRLRQYSGEKSIRIIAFKLTDSGDQRERDRAAQGLLKSSGADVVVQNDRSEVADMQRNFRVWTTNHEVMDVAGVKALTRACRRPAVN